jgi:hypothetical protein
MGRGERHAFVQYAEDRLRDEGAMPAVGDDLRLVRTILRRVGTDVLVLTKGDVVHTVLRGSPGSHGLFLSPPESTGPHDPVQAPQDLTTTTTTTTGDTPVDPFACDHTVRRMNRLFTRERKRGERKSRLREFLRTGIRQDISASTGDAPVDRGGGGGGGGGDGTTVSGAAAAVVTTAGTRLLPGAGGLGDVVPPRTDDARRRVRWAKLSAWHRYDVVRRFVEENPDGHADDDPAFATRVRAVLAAEEAATPSFTAGPVRRLLSDPAPFVALPEPVYDHKVGRVVCLAPAPPTGAKKKKKKKKKKTTRKTKRASSAAPASSASVSRRTRRDKTDPIVRCRMARERKERLESASVTFVGAFVSTAT